MKLILKRMPTPVRVHVIGDAEMCRAISAQYKERPFAIYTEDGVILPRQQSVVTESLPGKCPTVTVTFYLDGEDVKLHGDD